MTMIDLMPFCCPEDANRPYLETPFIDGGLSCATDGYIAIRISPVDGMRSCPTEIQFDRMFDRPRPSMTVATITVSTAKCKACGGRGMVHDCPDCTCFCNACNGEGELTPYVALRGATFAVKYVRLIAALPHLELPVTTGQKTPMYFRFDGGDGLLMPVNLSGREAAVPGESP